MQALSRTTLSQFPSHVRKPMHDMSRVETGVGFAKNLNAGCACMGQAEKVRL